MDAGPLLFFWLGFSGIVALAANSRGRSAVGWFLLAVVLSPVLALIAVLVMAPRSSQTAQLAQSSTSAASLDSRKVCPDCGEQVPVVARICRFCRYEFKGMPAGAPSGGGTLSSGEAAGGPNGDGTDFRRRTF
jgi:ribosomal protein L40E